MTKVDVVVLIGQLQTAVDARDAALKTLNDAQATADQARSAWQAKADAVEGMKADVRSGIDALVGPAPPARVRQ